MQQLQVLQWASVPLDQQQIAREGVRDVLARALDLAAFEWRVGASELDKLASAIRRRERTSPAGRPAR